MPNVVDVGRIIKTINFKSFHLRIKKKEKEEIPFFILAYATSNIRDSDFTHAIFMQATYWVSQ